MPPAATIRVKHPRWKDLDGTCRGPRHRREITDRFRTMGAASARPQHARAAAHGGPFDADDQLRGVQLQMQLVAHPQRYRQCENGVMACRTSPILTAACPTVVMCTVNASADCATSSIARRGEVEWAIATSCVWMPCSVAKAVRVPRVDADRRPAEQHRDEFRCLTGHIGLRDQVTLQCVGHPRERIRRRTGAGYAASRKLNRDGWLVTSAASVDMPPPVCPRSRNPINPVSARCKKNAQFG